MPTMKELQDQKAALDAKSMDLWNQMQAPGLPAEQHAALEQQFREVTSAGAELYAQIQALSS